MLRFTAVTATLIILALGGPHLAEGQPTKEQIQQNRERLAAHFVAVHGSRAPEAIPYAQKMSNAFQRLGDRRAVLGAEVFVSELGARFAGTPAQQRALDEGITEGRALRSELDQRQMGRLKSACSDLLAGTISTSQIAERVDALRDEWFATLEAHYRAVMDNVGAQMRINFMAYVDTEIVPKTGYGTVNSVAWANEFPDSYGRFITQRCERADDWPLASEMFQPVAIGQ